jgi:hypothetical protein
MIAVVAVIGVAAVLALVLAPAQRSTAHPDNTLSGGPCSDCHPSTTSTFLTITNLPTTTYTPSAVYTITITIADANGATGQNSFDFSVSAGTLSSTDPNVQVLANNTEAHAAVYTVSSWTLVWTAPASGSVQVETWGVYGGGSRSTSPWNHDLRTLSGTAIPEFPALLLPIIGVLATIVVAAKVSPRRV